MINAGRRSMARQSALWLALARHSRAYPFATNLSLISIPVGLLAVTLGTGVSRAFADVFDRPEPVYVWGAVLLFGGVNVAYGIARHIPSRERAGLFVLAIAHTFYGSCVIIGLGWHGLVTGPTFLVLALSCAQRARSILARARDDAMLNGLRADSAARGAARIARSETELRSDNDGRG